MGVEKVACGVGPYVRGGGGEKKEKKYTFAINVSENGCTN